MQAAPSSSASEDGLPLLAFTDGGDALARAAARAAARLDVARARAQVRELHRVAAMPGATAASIAAAKTRADTARRFAEASEALAARSHIEPMKLSPDSATLHGRIVGRKGTAKAELKVQATVDGKVVAEGKTDARGYYRLDLPAAKGDKAKGMPADLAVKVSVLRGDKVVHEDKTATSVRPGRHRYRELVVTS